MWLITTLITAISATILWYVAPKIYKLDLLSLMFWGASFMILVDHLLDMTVGLSLKWKQVASSLMASYLESLC